jgi:hypothetical protein
MTRKPPLRLFTFEVTLIETVTVRAEDEDAARRVIARTPPQHPPFRYSLTNGDVFGRIMPTQSIRQEQVSLLSAEDDAEAIRDEASLDYAFKDFERQLNDRFKGLDKRIDDLAAAIQGQKKTDP